MDPVSVSNVLLMFKNHKLLFKFKFFFKLKRGEKGKTKETYDVFDNSTCGNDQIMICKEQKENRKKLKKT